MEVIASILIDKHGHIKYVPQCFKPDNVDICVSNIEIGKIGKKTLYYAPLVFVDGNEDIVWTIRETMRRCEEAGAKSIKIFTRIQDFYDEITELQFAYKDELEDWNEELDMCALKLFCNNAKREFLGEANGIKFFRYIIDKK